MGHQEILVDREQQPAGVMRARFPAPGVDDAHPANRGFEALFTLDLMTKDMELAETFVADAGLDPALLDKFTLSPLIAKLVVEGFINGLHRSPFHGFSVEFADHREYVPGDDLKYLDWQVFARTDRYYIKRYEEETNLRAYILLDRSASMGFGTGKVTKWDYGCFLATCLAYLIIKQQDAVGLSLFGAKPGLLLPPRSRMSRAPCAGARSGAWSRSATCKPCPRLRCRI